MSTVFKIKDVVEPRWGLELPDGTVREYDPWKLQMAIHEADGKEGTAFYDAIRTAFGLPAESEATEGVFTFTCNQCLAAAQALGDYIESLPVSKKASSLSQK